MKKVCIVMIAGTLMALEWQELPKVPIGRADDIAIGYFYESGQWHKRIYVADQYSWPYRSNDGGITWDSLYLDPVDAHNPIAIVCDPNNAKNVWIARSEDYENPGVFYSSDEGNTWTPRNDSITNFKILTLKMAPDNPNFLFLGCRYDPNTSSNIFKTENGGITWHALTNIEDDVYSIATPSANSEIIYVAAGKRIYKSVDGGINWRLIYDPDYISNMFDIKVKPSDPAIIYALGFEFWNGMFYILKSMDGGNSFEIVFNERGIAYSLEVIFNNTEIVYCPVYSSSCNQQVIWYSTGNGWFPIYREQGIYAGFPKKLKVDPRNRSFLVLVGDGCIYRSLNNGNTWEQINYNMREKYPQKFNIVKGKIIASASSYFSASPILKLLLLYRKDINSEKWTTIFNDVYYPDYGHGIHQEPWRPDTIFLIWDWGEYGIEEQNFWVGAYTNDGIHFYYSNAAPPPPDLFIRQIKGFETWPSPYLRSPAPPPTITFGVCKGKKGAPHDAGKLFKTRNGNTWKWKPVRINNEDIHPISIALSPNDSAIIYLGVEESQNGNIKGVIRSEDGGNTWRQTGLTTDTVFSLKSVSKFPNQPQMFDILYAGTNTGIWKTKNSGTEWKKIYPPPILSAQIYSIALDPEDNSIIYAGGYLNPPENSFSLLLSVDAGRKFVEVPSNLPQDTLKDIQIDYKMPDSVFVWIANNGIWCSETPWEKDQLTSSSDKGIYPNAGYKIAYSRDTIWAVYESGNGIFITYSPDEGQNFLPKMEIDNGKYPCLGINPDYNPYIVFTRNDSLFGNGRILNGNWSETSWFFTNFPDHAMNYPSFLIRNDGTGFVAFSLINQLMRQLKVGYFDTRIPDPEFNLLENAYTGCDLWEYCLGKFIYNGEEVPAVAYVRGGENSSTVYFKYYIPGSGWSTEEQVSPSSHSAHHPFLGLTPERIPCCVWVHTPQPDVKLIYYSQRLSTGWSRPIILSSSTCISDYPQIYYPSPLLVGWQQLSLTGNQYQIVFRYKTPYGWSDFIYLDSGCCVPREYPNFASDGGNKVFSIFQKSLGIIYEIPFRKRILFAPPEEVALYEFGDIENSGYNLYREGYLLNDSTVEKTVDFGDSLLYKLTLPPNTYFLTFLTYSENPVSQKVYINSEFMGVWNVEPYHLSSFIKEVSLTDSVLDIKIKKINAKAKLSLIFIQKAGRHGGPHQLKGNELIPLFKIYPNIIKEKFSIIYKINKFSPVEISLYDPSGRKVLVLFKNKLPPGDYSMDFRKPADLKEGIYFIKLRINKEERNFKIIF
ncbi:MAG: T9SS type A sorting domain-containing protein [Thermoplasmata archaeon]